MTPWPETISNETELEEVLSRPYPELVEMMKRLDGDITILGVAGKMGVTLAMAAQRAIQAARVDKKVTGVARFSDNTARAKLEQAGIGTISCDLLDRDALEQLPQAKNVIYMAGRKFGTQGDPELTWALNVYMPGIVARHFSSSRIVAFSTGCVYPLVPASSGGSVEEDPPDPVGEYSQSCLGRERIFEHFSKINATPVCLFRLNYAIDLRYGVLYDIGRKVWTGEPVDVNVAHFNVIWQGDANNQALLSLEHCGRPASILNVTGPELLSTRQVALQFGELMRKDVTFRGEESPTAYLNNAAKAAGHFGRPRVQVQQMLRWTAQWIEQGGRSLNKPTNFEVSDGQY